VQIIVCEDLKIIELWLTNQDQADAALQLQLREDMRKYKDKGYRVVMFRSGERDLLACTKSLIRDNHQKIIEQELEELKKEA